MYHGHNHGDEYKYLICKFDKEEKNMLLMMLDI